MVRGARLGHNYVRVHVSHLGEFRRRRPGVVEATERVLQSRSVPGKVLDTVRRTLVGRRLPTSAQMEQRLPKYKALAVLSSDAISSVAYGPEAGLAILITAGAAALRLNLPIAGCIALLMVVVGLSYRQTIHAYPHGGGSYIVARDNLGDLPGLIAAAALLIDYVLVVSVSVASGVAALTSAIPALYPYSVPLGVAFILFMMVANLRGTRQSGAIFALPTYLFIGSFLIMIVIGVAHAALSSGGLTAAISTPPRPIMKLGWSPEPLTVLLILTAFASGCSAMTGVEALSNGVPVFKPPEAKNAARTLVATIAILVTLYVGITYLVWRFGIEPNAHSNPTVTAQIARLIFTGPFAWFYFVVQAATLIYLVLAANTSFSDFPRLSSILAHDGFLPHMFTHQGDRLAYSTGIVVLSGLATVLFIAFAGSTDALINLFALGVFTAFTLSQSGMVVHWFRARASGARNWRRSLLINGIGAATTAVVVVVIVLTKFDRGAWIVVLLIPVLVLTFRGIAAHYAVVRQQTEVLTPLHASEVHHLVVVPIVELNAPAIQALAYARSITANVVALHVAFDRDEEGRLREEWERFLQARRSTGSRLASAGGEPPAIIRGADHSASASSSSELAPQEPQLVTIESPYRALITPLVSYINALRDDNPNKTITVVLPEFVPRHWWEQALHNQTALRLKLALYSDPGVVVINVPYRQH